MAKPLLSEDIMSKLLGVRAYPYSIFPVSSTFINLLGSARAFVRASANMWVVGIH